MDSMNFLNKKYTSVHATNSLAHSRNRSSRAFLPNNNFIPMVHSQSLQNIQINQVPIPPTPSTQIVSNHCNIHPQQLIRHLCLDCIELLCSECISDHISVHKQNNTFPSIHTLKQVKSDMNLKLQQIMEYMFKQKNHPKNMANTVDSIRKQSGDKIQNLRKDLIEFVEQWINRLRISIMNNVGYEQVKLIQQEMYSLHDQVNQLINSISSNNASVLDVKKAYQIDADRLLKCYKQMMDKYLTLSDAMRVDIDLDGGKFIEGLEQSIALRIGGKTKAETIKFDDHEENDDNNEQQSEIFQNHFDENYVEPDQRKQLIENLKKQMNATEVDCIPLMYSIVSGTDIVRILDPSNSKLQTKTHKFQEMVSYPLNSSALLSDGMIVISGGMVAENKKSDIIQVFDYEEGKLVTQSKMNKGRSSHRTIINGDQIILIGGFSSQNQQCRDVEILTVNGVEVSPHKCKWGGPNLSIKTKNNQILKITVSGVETMNLSTMEWNQITTQVPFALSKGMQIASYISKQGTQVIVIFGDDDYLYSWQSKSKRLIKRESSLKKPVISATTFQNCIYGWVEDSKLAVYRLQEEGWKIVV